MSIHNQLPATNYQLPRVFALADTHLPGGRRNRGMERFGGQWLRHRETLLRRIWSTVRHDDILLLPGDLSWATKRRDAEDDLKFLSSLPGMKICIKGNHDFWWDSETPIDYPGLHSPPVILADGVLGIAGSRGWQAPIDGSEFAARDAMLLERERVRLVRSLDAIADCPVKIAMTHYPPQPYLPELAAADVKVVAYGHVHVGSLPHDEALAVFDKTIDGVTLYCVACDRIDFTPVRIL